MKKVELTLPKLRASQQHTDKITAEMLVDCRISNSDPKRLLPVMKEPYGH